MRDLIIQGVVLTLAAGAAYVVYKRLTETDEDKMGCLESKPEAPAQEPAVWTPAFPHSSNLGIYSSNLKHGTCHAVACAGACSLHSCAAFTGGCLGRFVLTAVGDVGQVKKTKVEAAAPATSNSTAKPAAAAAKPVRCPCNALRNSQTAKRLRAHLTLPIAHVYLFLYEAGGEEGGN
jgi:hypothetical protein